MSQALSDPRKFRVVSERDAEGDSDDPMRSFCALRAQISPTRRAVMIPDAVSKSFVRVGRGTAVALRQTATSIVGRFRA